MVDRATILTTVYLFLEFFKAVYRATMLKNVWLTLKGQSNEIFDLHFFHYSNLPGPLTNGFKVFLILVKISRSYSNFRFKITDSPACDTPGSNVLVGFFYYWLAGVYAGVYAGEIDLAIIPITPERLTRRSVIPRTLVSTAIFAY